MNKIIIPQKPKINQTEEVALPMVKCSVCHNMTMTGLHQVRMTVIEPAKTIFMNGKRMIKPAVMKQRHFYMCTNCVKSNKKWPGKRP